MLLMATDSSDGEFEATIKLNRQEMETLCEMLSWTKPRTDIQHEVHEAITCFFDEPEEDEEGGLCECGAPGYHPEEHDGWGHGHDDYFDE